MHHSTYITPAPGILCLALCLAIFGAPVVFGHGEVDAELLAEFHLHLDDFRADVEHLAEELPAVVRAHAAGRDTDAAMTELIEHWEEVGLHAAVESKAMALYPGIWQAIIALQQVAGSDRSTADVEAAAARVEAALWQGLGALRLAASQVEAGTATAPAVAAGEALSGPETVARIVADLEQALAAYRDDELARAESLIHQTYMTRFEGLEGDLIARDPELVSRLERDFNATLPLLMQEGADLARVNAALDAMKRQLETASEILRDVEQARSDVF